MRAFTIVMLGSLLLCMLAAAGCAKRETAAFEGKTPEVPLSCVAVLPVQSTVDYANSLSPEEDENLQTGRRVLDVLLREYLNERQGFLFVSGDDAVVLPNTGTGLTSLEGARQAAFPLGCNAVLETTIIRYKERIGADYGVREPAAVTFSYRLIETNEGRVLCHGRFDEKQEAVLDNLLNIDKLQHRKLGWLTAEGLTRAGLQENFQTCPYLR